MRALVSLVVAGAIVCGALGIFRPIVALRINEEIFGTLPVSVGDNLVAEMGDVITEGGCISCEATQELKVSFWHGPRPVDKLLLILAEQVVPGLTGVSDCFIESICSLPSGRKHFDKACGFSNICGENPNHISCRIKPAASQVNFDYRSFQSDKSIIGLAGTVGRFFGFSKLKILYLFLILI